MCDDSNRCEAEQTGAVEAQRATAVARIRELVAEGVIDFTVIEDDRSVG